MPSVTTRYPAGLSAPAATPVGPWPSKPAVHNKLSSMGSVNQAVGEYSGDAASNCSKLQGGIVRKEAKKRAAHRTTRHRTTPQRASAASLHSAEAAASLLTFAGLWSQNTPDIQPKTAIDQKMSLVCRLAASRSARFARFHAAKAISRPPMRRKAAVLAAAGRRLCVAAPLSYTSAARS